MALRPTNAFGQWLLIVSMFVFWRAGQFVFSKEMPGSKTDDAQKEVADFFKLTFLKKKKDLV